MIPLTDTTTAMVDVGTPRSWRLFAGPADEPRSRRVSDVIKVAGSVLALAVIGSVSRPPAGFERAVLTLIRVIPDGLDGLWQFLIDLLTLLAIGLVVAALLRRRWAVARDLAVAFVVAAAVWSVVARSVLGSWPALWDSVRASRSVLTFSPLRIVLPGTIVMTASPHLSQPARRLGRTVIVLGVVATVLFGSASPTGATAAVLVAAIGAATVHLVFGSPRGRPSLDDVAAALRGLEVDARALGVATRQPEGVFVVDAVDANGDPLVVKLYGRDAHDTQLVTSLWRTIWYREAGTPVLRGRLQQAEHEAFLTLLAGQAGVLTDHVVIAGATVNNDVLLVVRQIGRPVAELPEPWSEDLVRGLWQLIRRVHDTGIAHGQLDDRHVIVGAADIGLTDFRGATVTPTETQLHTDHAQALVTTAVGAGVDAALPAALDALGPSGLEAALPFVQLTALTARQRTLVREADLDLDVLRDRAAELAGVAAPDLQRLRRVTLRSVIQVVLLVVAFTALASGLTGLDFGDLWSQIQDAAWWLVLIGFLLAQSSRLAQAVSTLGASPTPLPLRPVYALQLATSYIALAVPSYAARAAVNIRFFQRHGLPAGSAVAIGALDALSQFFVQVVLLLGILTLTSASLEVEFGASVPTGLVRLVVVVLAVAIVAIAVVLVIPKFRRAILGGARRLLTDAFNAIKGLNSPRRLGMLFGGNIANEVLFAAALGAFTHALGYPVGLSELVLINISVSLLSGLIPIPGGIGVVEGGLTFGLVRAGVPEEAAFAAVLMYRLSTFYLPPIWGFFALRWLERNKHL